ncbi:MAG: DsbA family protein [Candidatus Paceibacterota bacterium]|jgi:protein-disulfide isomerase
MDTNETSNKYFLPAAVILAGLFIAGAVVWNGSRPANPPVDRGQGDGAPVVNIKDVKTEGEPFIGKADAPITIAFWSDFQCPFCRAFEVGHPQVPTPPAFPDIVKNYVDTGKVKIVFKDVVFLSPRMGMDSLTGVLYSQSVWKLYPDQYLAWRTAVMEAQDEEGGGFGNAASIDALNATIAGIDAVKVAADVQANTDAYTQKANATTEEAQQLGVNSTPSSVIGTQLVVGALPFAAFQSAIDALLQ